MSAAPAQDDRWACRARVAVVAAYLLLALAYTVIIPHGYGPDELRHCDYVRYVAAHWQLPLTDTPPDGLHPHSQHPPAYYMLLLPFYLASRAAGPTTTYVVLRLVSVALGLGFVLFTGATVGVLVPRPAWFRWYVAAVVALLPHFQLYAAVVHNDALTNTLSAAFLWLAVSRLDAQPPVRLVALLGVLAGIGALTKGSLVVALPFVFALVLAARLGLGFWRTPAFWRSTALLVAIQAAVGGWWYVERLLTFGSLRLIPPGYETIPPGVSLSDVLASGLLARLAWRAIDGLFRSTWAQVGWIPQPLEPAFYAAFALWTLVALLGFVVFLRQKRIAQDVEHAGRFLVATPILYYVWVYLWVLYTAVFVHLGHYEGGRYAFPALGGLALLLALPHLVASSKRLRLAFGAFTLALLAAANVASIYNLITHLTPTYAPSWHYLFL